MKRLLTVSTLILGLVMPGMLKAQTYAVHGSIGAPEGALDLWSGGIGLYVDNRVSKNQWIRTQLSSYQIAGAGQAYTSINPAAVLKYNLGGGWGLNVSGGPDFSIDGNGEVNVRTGLEVTKNMFKTDFVKGRVGFEQIYRDDRNGPDLFNLYLGVSVTPPAG